MIDSKASKISLMQQNKLEFLLSCVNQTKDLNGDVVEVGVYKGGSARVLCQNLKESNIYLIDTFEGLVDACEYDNVHTNGAFNETSIDIVKQTIFPYNNYTIIKSKWPNDDNKVLDSKTFKFVHLDVDMYVAYKENLEYFYPRLEKDGLILCDDYGCVDCLGAKKAIDEFVESNNLKSKFSLGAGTQCLIKK